MIYITNIRDYRHKLLWIYTRTNALNINHITQKSSILVELLLFKTKREKISSLVGSLRDLGRGSRNSLIIRLLCSALSLHSSFFIFCFYLFFVFPFREVYTVRMLQHLLSMQSRRRNHTLFSLGCLFSFRFNPKFITNLFKFWPWSRYIYIFNYELDGWKANVCWEKTK